MAPQKPEEKRRFGPMPALCAAGALFFALALGWFHWRVVRASYPQEYRESSMPAVTALLMRGGNPYDLEHQPQYTTNYGIGYHWAVLPLAAWMGPTLTAHRMVSGLFIVCACALLAIILSMRSVPPIETALLALALYAQLLFYVQPLARPDGLGFFLFLASLFAAWASKFSPAGLAACGALALLGFYTKAYCAAGALYVFIYCFLYVKKIRALLFAALFGAALAGTAWLMKDAYPAYFNNTVLAQASAAHWSWRHLANQFLVFLYFNKYLLALFAAPFALQWWRKHTYSKAAAPQTAQAAPQPAQRPDFFLFCFLAGCVLIAVRFGAHNGAWMTYWLQLLSPFLIILAAGAAKRSGMALACGLLLVNLYSWRFSLLEQDNPAGYEQRWAALAELMEQGMKTGDVLAAPPLEYYAMRDGKSVHFTGQTVFFTPADPPRALKAFFLPREAMQRRLDDYINWVNGALARREFSMVLLTRPDSAGIDPKMDRDYTQEYELLEEMPQANQAVTIRVYKPRPGQPLAARTTPFRSALDARRRAATAIALSQ
ncbi:MAG: hypothetical protein GX410_04240 [Elusimicrobia bacterium]|nr:hypothetical protein [Elusimicrobiota bacterium]